jgi:hypothetical protein
MNRIAPAAALVAGLASIADQLVQLRHVQPDSGWQALDLVIEALFALSLLGSAVALGGLPAWLGVRRTGRVAGVVAQVGFGLLLVSAVASMLAGGNTLGLAFSLGLALALLGLLVLGIAGLVRSARRWAAPLPFVALLLSVVLAGFGGQLVLGVLWLGLAWVMTARARQVVAA